MRNKRIIQFAVAAGLLAAMAIPTLGAECPPTPEITTRLDLSYVTKYIWRGAPLDPDPALQPAVTFTHKSGVSLNVWGSYDLTDANGLKDNITEIDYTLNYAKSLPKGCCWNAGVVDYTFPNTSAPSTSEVYGSYCLGGKFSPALQAYYDFVKAHGVYASLSGGYSCALPYKSAPSAGLSARLSYGTASHNRYNYYGADSSGITDILLGAALPITLTPKWSLTPAVNYSSMINGTVKDAFNAADKKTVNWFGGITLSYAI